MSYFNFDLFLINYITYFDINFKFLSVMHFFRIIEITIYQIRAFKYYLNYLPKNNLIAFIIIN